MKLSWGFGHICVVFALIDTLELHWNPEQGFEDRISGVETRQKITDNTKIDDS